MGRSVCTLYSTGIIDALVAQLVERPPHKWKIVGLNLTHGSEFLAVLGELCCYAWSIKSLCSLNLNITYLFMRVVLL